MGYLERQAISADKVLRGVAGKNGVFCCDVVGKTCVTGRGTQVRWVPGKCRIPRGGRVPGEDGGILR